MAPQDHDDDQIMHNQLVPDDNEEWNNITTRKNKRSLLLLNGASDDNKKLELRLGPPGDHHDHDHQLQISDHNKKACSVPAGTAVSKFANSSAPNCYQKSTTSGRAPPVVGWPPIRSCRKNLGSGSFLKTAVPSITNYDHDDESKKEVPVQQDQGKKSEVDHMFVKINMEGFPIGRKVDLKAYDSYEKLSYAIDQLFRGLLAVQSDYSVSESNGQTGDHTETVINGEYTLVYEDNEGDRMLVGDVPWKMFVSTAKRLRVLRSIELSTLKLSSSTQIIETRKDTT